MSKKPIEQKIKEKYQIEYDIWLIEKGKTNEIRMIKECYHRIEDLKKEIEDLNKQKDSNEKAYFRILQDKLRIKLDYEKKLRECVDINKQLIKRFEEIKEAILETEIKEKTLDELKLEE